MERGGKLGGRPNTTLRESRGQRERETGNNEIHEEAKQQIRA